MANENDSADTAPVVSPIADANAAAEEAKKVEDLVGHAQTPEHGLKVRALEAGSTVKIPTDLSKVSPAKARELAATGLVEDADLPGKMYKRKADGFVARIPDYTYEAYNQDLQDEWEEIKLPTADKQDQ